ncbi:hypothetical protein [Sedimentisphaera salicampi]|uniref:hypothetical protein n=1 Tax=Sedimentisphaera salicampi TaxID=1941349 RepID=UPI000B9A4E77|nr:hypothetical protein [Sedimentisphaera salicampi]OXU15452.1 hypothetical protein SMSP1_00933 [Sedimentisphaera salicampi]
MMDPDPCKNIPRGAAVGAGLGAVTGFIPDNGFGSNFVKGVGVGIASVADEFVERTGAWGEQTSEERNERIDDAVDEFYEALF